MKKLTCKSFKKSYIHVATENIFHNFVLNWLIKKMLRSLVHNRDIIAANYNELEKNKILASKNSMTSSFHNIHETVSSLVSTILLFIGKNCYFEMNKNIINKLFKTKYLFEFKSWPISGQNNRQSLQNRKIKSILKYK